MQIATKRLGGLVALTVAGLLTVTACGTTSSSGGSVQASAGYADCSKSPDTCNSGPRKDGGDIVVALGKYPSTWNNWSSDGNVVETVQQENLIVPTDEPRTRSVSLASEGERQGYSDPAFEKYDDMADLILLDPVHEIDQEKGWPKKAPEE